jgi:tRNA (adenine22-N1)-methyltransferase
MNYSERIQTLAELVDSESAADIGTDHAYIPRLLLENGICSYVIASDINEGPLKIARDNLKELDLDKNPWKGSIECHLRLGAGLEPIESGEVESIVIAGMGGETIIDILEAEPEKTKSFRQFILQPRSKTELVRKWLDENGFYILNELLVKEGARYCQIIDARTELPVLFAESGGLAGAPYERFQKPEDYIIPPFFIEDMSDRPLIREYLEAERQKTAELIKNMQNAAEPDLKEISFRRNILEYLNKILS